ncbi:FAD-binding oxidoreductase [Pseudomonas sp. B2M1-30]|uniref:NAD(P)/FAD-dependent oxidoreductase n=1 Tax=Pseudomonas TaxID=286 RepID=UPI0021C621BB|nr:MULTISPECIES: FAD-binding oxidoreductase [Pseudomonas]MCU0117732.1 FAD-binding oxidoreductase [Pseudomonas sp. B2M1-30]MCU7259268.1 FAD-binding oxidoreductase [Pseudomonas koreensis]
MRSHRDKRIVIVGAGIVGASLAYHLSAKKAHVTLVDAGEIASGVTATSFAWITAAHCGSDPISQLRGAAIEEYRRLEAQVPGLDIRWTGALSYDADAHQTPPPDGVLSANLVSRARILELEPHLKRPPRQAMFAAQEGALDAVAATYALVGGARQNGAKILTHTPVDGFISKGNQVIGVETASGVIDADVVVMAAGTGIKMLTEQLQTPVPVTASPAIFIRYKARPNLVRTLISSPEMEVRQCADGTLLAAEDYLDNTPENRPQAIALRTARAIQNELDGVVAIEAEVACVGLRPMPEDGIPIIGYLPQINGVYICAMHPGVTLAAVVGRRVSEEIVDLKVAPALAACRPDRFFQAD